jgi:hypothetical protein
MFAQTKGTNVWSPFGQTAPSGDRVNKAYRSVTFRPTSPVTDAQPSYRTLPFSTSSSIGDGAAVPVSSVSLPSAANGLAMSGAGTPVKKSPWQLPPTHHQPVNGVVPSASPKWTSLNPLRSPQLFWNQAQANKEPALPSGGLINWTNKEPASPPCGETQRANKEPALPSGSLASQPIVSKEPSSGDRLNPWKQVNKISVVQGNTSSTPTDTKKSELNSAVFNDIENSLTDEWWNSLFENEKNSLPSDGLGVSNSAYKLSTLGGNELYGSSGRILSSNNTVHATSSEPSSLNSSSSNTAAALRLSGLLQRTPAASNGVTTNGDFSGHTLASPSKKVAPPTLPKDTRKMGDNAILSEWKAGLSKELTPTTKGPRTMQYDMMKEASLLKERPRVTSQVDPAVTQLTHDDLSVYGGVKTAVDDRTNDSQTSSGGRGSVDDTKKEAKPVVYEGIGPMDEQTGVPIATRKSVDESHHKDWYRCMYKSLHKHDKQSDANNPIKPTFILDEADVKTKCDDIFRSPSPTDSTTRAQSPGNNESLYPPHAKYRPQKYKNQPMKIEDYEPGFHSSIAQKQAKTCESERLLENLKTTDGDSHDTKHSTSTTLQQRRRASSRSASRADERTFRQQWDEENHKRRLEIERVMEAERHKRFMNEQRDIQSRKHSDYLNPLQKSSILLNRFDEDALLTADSLERPVYKAPTRSRGKARAVHTFHAQNNRELSLQKGDTVYLLRQIDKNWFKGERHGMVGIFPISYVEVLSSIDEAQVNAGLREGTASARYNFKGQSSKELSLRKGDVVKLVRRLDDNWYEARAGNRQGIVPVAYLETNKEPETPQMTPMSSRAATPVQGRLSPASSVISVGPDIPSAPISPWMSDFYDSEFEGTDQRRTSRSRDSTLDRSMTNKCTTRSSINNYNAPGKNISSAVSPSATNYMCFRSQNILDQGPYVWPRSEPSTMSLDSSISRRGTDGRRNTEPRDLFDIARQRRRQDNEDPHGLDNWSTTGSLPTARDAECGSRLAAGNSLDRKLTSSLRAKSSSPSLLVTSSKTAEHQPKATTDNKLISRYRATYAYTPLHSDELELHVGDIVQVMEKCEDGWFVGTSQRTNEFGTFPGNYVQCIDTH